MTTLRAHQRGPHEPLSWTAPDLLSFLKRVPAIDGPVGTGSQPDGTWWIKFAIDIEHPLAWNVIQEFGHVLNLVSIDEPLPTVFKPVSPPPYMNGGPREFLSWVIESHDPGFGASSVAEWLAGRLPDPVDDITAWQDDDDDE